MPTAPPPSKSPKVQGPFIERTVYVINMLKWFIELTIEQLYI